MQIEQCMIETALGPLGDKYPAGTKERHVKTATKGQDRDKSIEDIGHGEAKNKPRPLWHQLKKGQA